MEGTYPTRRDPTMRYVGVAQRTASRCSPAGTSSPTTGWPGKTEWERVEKHYDSSYLEHLPSCELTAGVPDVLHEWTRGGGTQSLLSMASHDHGGTGTVGAADSTAITAKCCRGSDGPHAAAAGGHVHAVASVGAADAHAPSPFDCAAGQAGDLRGGFARRIDIDQRQVAIRHYI